jgi:hypothetical protein
MFPTKAVRIWRASSDRARIELVQSYMEHAGNFEDIRGGLANPTQSPAGDPIFVVASLKKQNADRPGDATGP